MGDWTYTRITTAPKDATPEFIGVMNTIPTEIEAGLPVMVGDYFVASEDFEEDGVEFKKGVPYVCVDPEVFGGWEEMVFNQENTAKAMTCLGGILNSGIAVPSTAAIYGWFENLVAQNAVIQNLFSQAITILNGGSIQSEEFVDGTTGFKIDSNGNAVFANARLTGESYFSGKFQCSTISSMKGNGGVTVSASIRAYGGNNSANQWNDLNGFFSNNGLLDGVTYNCTSSAYPSVAHIKKTGNIFAFYDSSMGETGSASKLKIGLSTIYQCSGVRDAQTLSVNIGGGDILKLHGVQQGSTGLEDEQIYWASVNGYKVICIK